MFFNRGDIPAVLVKELDDLIPQVSSLPYPSPGELNAAIHAKLGPHYTFHCLRHGRATDLFASGIPLSRLMVLGRWETRAAVTCYLH